MDQSSSSVNLLYYDCFYYDNLTITKRLEFINNEGNNYKFEIDINVFKYENKWHFTAINMPIKKPIRDIFFLRK